MRKVSISMDELVPILQMQMETAGSAVLTVTGYSMLPMLHNGKDTVRLTPVKGAVKKGDLILYKRDNGVYVLHRILCVKGSTLICCGDNQYITEKIGTHQVLAVVSGFVRNGKTYRAEDRGYRAYVFWWVALHPIRILYLIPRRLLGWILAMIRRWRRGKRLR